MSKLGGKGKNLDFLQKNGISVPRWFAMTTDHYDLHFQKIEREVNKELNNLDHLSISNLENLKSVANKIKEYFSDLPLNVETENYIKKELEKFTATSVESFFAVRSSASLEDSKESSFAGQLETFLYIPKGRIRESIKECFASGFNERVLQYLYLNKIRGHNLKVAVIIQEMVHSKISGIMFTADPRADHKSNHLIITSGYGQGEGIVSDEVESDTFILSKNELTIREVLLNSKKSQLLFDLERGYGLKKCSLPEELREKPSLTKKQLNDLAQLGLKIEKLYGHPQDIEWAIDDQNRIYITQSRPITTLSKKETKTKSGNEFCSIFDNSNIVESFPGVNTPLTLSVVRIIYSTVFKNAVKALGLSKQDLKDQDLLLNCLIGHYQGRIYYNLTNWYKMMRLFPFTESYIKVWETMLGVEIGLETNQKTTFLRRCIRFIKGVRNFIFYFIFLSPILKNLEKRTVLLFKRFDFSHQKSNVSNYHDLILKDQPHFTFTTLTPSLNSFISQIFFKWEITLLNDAYAFIFSGLTRSLLGKWIPRTEEGKNQEEGNELFNNLMCGISGMDSVGPIKSLVHMAEVLRKNNFIFDSSLEKLIGEHIHQFGDRGLNELKLESLTLREDVASLKKLITEYAHSDMSLEKMDNHEQNLQEKAKIRINKVLKYSPLKRIIISLSLYFAKRSILYREKFRLHRSRAYGIIRQIVRISGLELERKGIIKEQNDIFFLELHEIMNYSIGQHYDNDLKKLILLRKELYLKYQEEVTSHERVQFFEGQYTPLIQKINEKDLEAQKKSKILKGQGCSSGVIKAPCLVVTDLSKIEKDSSIIKGKILVAKMTDPGWVFLMTVAKGLIVEKGSILSHTAIIGRELGIPTIVGVKEATSLLSDGDMIEMNGESGEIHF